ncbi:MAG TPA: hypothetical protein VN700_17545 [Vicinamibacterales bacterium]|nr:hypothetical protein [Vicinamibacterales bacterium]
MPLATGARLRAGRDRDGIPLVRRADVPNVRAPDRAVDQRRQVRARDAHIQTESTFGGVRHERVWGEHGASERSQLTRCGGFVVGTPVYIVVVRVTGPFRARGRVNKAVCVIEPVTIGVFYSWPMNPVAPVTATRFTRGGPWSPLRSRGSLCSSSIL